MTTPLYPTFVKRIDDGTAQLIQQQVDPWAFLNTGKPMLVKTFLGKDISYEGIGFEGSPRHVYWSRYIEPFLEDLAVKEISAAAVSARERSVDARLLLREVEGLLQSACNKVFRRMAEIDQRLLGRGFPQNATFRSVEPESKAMREFIAMHVQAELQMWKPRRWYEQWFERNKFLPWLLGLLASAAVGLAIKLL